ncbi:unnamed protein product [Symbiodinium natans]|uniref:AAA+ ATPase domain-containing protein n=1 Tax=Symbiodinium natans TaxID=878477 RepID=A0A812LDY5_9DINO|nr:unnamed protein product [Symbiodinium natans]
MAVKRTLGKLLLALAATTLFPPQAALAGWRGHEKPVAEHQILDIARWPVQSKDLLVNLATAAAAVAAAVFAFAQIRIMRRDSERAQRESKEGRIQAAADRMLQPFLPNTKEENVVKRAVIEDIRQRIMRWSQHATIIAGRYGCGKTVALEEALRGMQGVHVHTVKDRQWEEKLYAVLGLGDEEMFRKVLQKIRQELNQTPVLVLDIPRSTKEGMDSISSFAKTFSSDGSLAHVIVCASSAAMAMAFDAGGDQRQENYWVEDLTKEEAQELLALRGRTDWEQFVAACGYNALDLVRTCEKYTGPETLAAKQAEMEKRAREEVQTFRRDCKFQTVDDITPAGANILNALLQNRGGLAVGKLEGGSGASPEKVAMWIREEKCHPVVWHMVKREYQFASELHAQATESSAGEVETSGMLRWLRLTAMFLHLGLGFLARQPTDARSKLQHCQGSPKQLLMLADVCLKACRSPRGQVCQTRPGKNIKFVKLVKLVKF